MSSYLYKLSPPTDEGPFQSESELLGMLSKLDRRGQLGGRRIHVFERLSVGQEYKGRLDAVTVLRKGEIDTRRIGA